jgi:hypothetical protein
MILPSPPNPQQYKGEAFNRAVYDWMNLVKGRLEQSQSIANGVPIQSPSAGDLVYRSPLAWARLAAGTAGQVLTQGTSTAPVWSGISSVLDSIGGTQGDMLYRGTAWTRLPAGTSGQLLTQGTAIPAWSNLSTVLDKISGTQGDILYRGSAAWSQLSAGTSGDFLRTGGTSANPSWLTTPKIKTGSTTHTVSTTGTQAVTGVGFSPKSLIIISAVNGTTAASFGLSDGTTHLFMNDQTALSAGVWQIGSTFIIVLRTGAADQATASVALDSDGFTLTWAKTNSPTGTATINYIAIG